MVNQPEIDPEIQFFEIQEGAIIRVRAEKKDKQGGVHWAQLYTSLGDDFDMGYVKRQLTFFIHEQERESTATGEGSG